MVESTDARISALEEQFRLVLNGLSATIEDVRRRLPEDPRIAHAVDQLVGNMQPKPQPRRVAVRVERS